MAQLYPFLIVLKSNLPVGTPARGLIMLLSTSESHLWLSFIPILVDLNVPCVCGDTGRGNNYPAKYLREPFMAQLIPLLIVLMVPCACGDTGTGVDYTARYLKASFMAQLYPCWLSWVFDMPVETQAGGVRPGARQAGELNGSHLPFDKKEV